MIATSDIPEEAHRGWSIAYVVLFFSLWSAASFGLLITLGISMLGTFRNLTAMLVPCWMLLLTAVFSLVIWSLLTHRRADARRWMMLGGALSALASFLFVWLFYSFNVIPFYFNFVYFQVGMIVIGTVHSLGAALVVGSVVCAVPLMVPTTLLHYGAYSRVMVTVSSAFFFSPLLLLSILVSSAVVRPETPAVSSVALYVWCPLVAGLVQVVLVVCSCCLLSEIRLGPEESCPLTSGFLTFWRSRPSPPVLCLSFAAQAATIVTVAAGYLLLAFPRSEGCVTWPFSGIANCTLYNPTFAVTLTPATIWLPTLAVPLIINYFRDWQCVCKVLGPILCAATGAALYFTISVVTSGVNFNYSTYFPLLVAFSACRTLLIGVAYSDLLQQVFKATNDGSLVPVGTGGVSITVGAFGAIVGILSTFPGLREAVNQGTVSSLASMALWHSVVVLGLNLAACVWRAGRDECQRRRYEGYSELN